MARDVAARGSHFSGPDSAQHTMTTLFSSSSHENSTDLSHANRQHPAPQSLPWRGKMGDKGDRGSSGGCKADCCAIGAPRDASTYGNQAVLQACKWEKAAVPTQHQLETILHCDRGKWCVGLHSSMTLSGSFWQYPPLGMRDHLSNSVS